MVILASDKVYPFHRGFGICERQTMPSKTNTERLAPAASGNKRVYQLIVAGTQNALEELGWVPIMVTDPHAPNPRAMYLSPYWGIHWLDKGRVKIIKLDESFDLYRTIAREDDAYHLDPVGFDRWLGMVHKALLEGGHQ